MPLFLVFHVASTVMWSCVPVAWCSIGAISCDVCSSLSPVSSTHCLLRHLLQHRIRVLPWIPLLALGPMSLCPLWVPRITKVIPPPLPALRPALCQAVWLFYLSSKILDAPSKYVFASCSFNFPNILLTAPLIWSTALTTSVTSSSALALSWLVIILCLSCILAMP